MKKIIVVSFVAFVLQGLLCRHAFAQNNVVERDSTIRYYARLAGSTAEADKDQLRSELYALLKSDQEKDWLTARRFFYQMKMINVADSITKADKQKFPLGLLSRDEQVDTVFKEKDPVKKEALYEAWVKKFPPAQFPGSERIMYEYARNAVANAYADADNVGKALQYANMIETAAWKGEGWASTAGRLMKMGHLKEAAALYKKARDTAYKFLTTNRNDPGAGFAATGFVGYSRSLAMIYARQKNYSKALPYIRDAHDSSKRVNGSTNAEYAKILMALGKNKEAFNIIDEAIRVGQATAEMKAALKTLWPKVKGSRAGYDEHLVSVNKILAGKVREDLKKQMIELPAPTFVLKDVDGNTVSLSDLKGKIVVLDFWATWCGPCKASFPSMRSAVERFKDNQNVKFLFIHTWERSNTAPEEAKKYIVDNNYPFEVLMDLKNEKGVNEVVESYKVQGIPTKFVIDKEGKIRFRFTGFSGGEDLAVEEIAAMVELAAR